VAISIPFAVRQQLFDSLKPVVAQDREIRQILPENMHITLKFLGETEIKKIDKIKDVLGKIAGNFSDFYYRIGENIGAFPRIGLARIIFAPIDEGCEQLSYISESVEKGLAAIGIKKEKKQFKAHITLARLRVEKDLTDQSVKIKFICREPVKCSKISLIESILKPSGAEYAVIWEFSLLQKT